MNWGKLIVNVFFIYTQQYIYNRKQYNILLGIYENHTNCTANWNTLPYKYFFHFSRYKVKNSKYTKNSISFVSNEIQWLIFTFQTMAIYQAFSRKHITTHTSVCIQMNAFVARLSSNATMLTLSGAQMQRSAVLVAGFLGFDNSFSLFT